MTQIIREITADVAQTNNLRAITAKQNDLNSRFLKIHITNEGIPIKVNPNVQIIMNVRRTDNTVRMFYGSVNEDGSITVPLTQWMLELEGSINCDVSIVSTEDLQKLTTMQFSIYVEAAVFPQNDLMNSDEYDVLVELLNAAEDAEKCVEATEEAKEATEQAKQAANGVVITEQNSGSLLTFWVGTQEEYDAIVTKDTGCFYIISDDPAMSQIDAKIAAVAKEVQNLHTPYDISGVVVPRYSKDTYTLTKNGNTLTLTYFVVGKVSEASESIAENTVLATIKGYVPVQAYYTHAVALVKLSNENALARNLVLEPDDTGKNTRVVLLDKTTTLYDSAIGRNLLCFTISFVCK